VLGIIGVLLWAVGLFFEGVATRRWSGTRNGKMAQPADEVKGSVMDKGLWRFARHPTYFGDACVWTGILLVSAERWPGVLTIPATVLMIYLLTFGSGKRNLERSMVKRPGYPE